VLSAMMILPFINLSDTKATGFTMKGTIHSDSAILINLDCDTLIFEKNADAKQMPGPLVNIMTAVICIENCPDLSSEVTVDESVYSALYETEYNDDLRFADIYDSDVLQYTDLLYAMMLTSSIEASQTIAYNISGGNIPAFVEMMNEKAAEIGLDATHFTNATGMYDPKQYTTARDIAKLTQYALNLPKFDEICSTYVYSPVVPNLENHPDRQSWKWYHSNLMMDEESEYYYQGVRGIKTANLEKSGRNIVALSSRDGNNYLAVAMKSPINDSSGDTVFYHIEDAADMFDWAYSHFSYKVILADTAELGELPVELADGNDYVLARPEREVSLLWYDEIDVSLINRSNIVWNQEKLQAPVNAGELLGQVTLEFSGEPLATVNLVAVSDVKRSGVKYNIYAAKLFPKSRWFKNAFIISGILCGLYIVLCIYAVIMRQKRRKPMKPKYAVPKVDKKNKK
ncbi:MAG: D-alanyl-D-alanine carboxypeptidase, partial [Ruminococcus sp.]|nr:D-alanyl-D-alanine carboxypeptidase [Ruminococcus sp.]